MDDLIGEFITETTENLALLDSELVKLEQYPGDEKILGNIFRAAHTIKGTCGFLGLPRLEAVAHASENVLGKIRDKKLNATPQAVSLILESLDNIKGLVDYLSQNGKEADGDDAALIARLNSFAEGKAEITPEEVKAETPDAGDMSRFFKGDDELENLLQKHDAPVAPVAAPTLTPAAAHKTSEKPETKDASGKDGAAAQSIRVNLDVLETLMQMVGELVLTRNQLMQIVRSKDDRELLSPLQHLSHITTELQESVMKTRMQPISNAWSKFPRLVRDLSLELGKKIELRMIGAETELDRQLLEMIKDPLTHMVRNSCDHGLELPADRKATGKSEAGTVTLSAYHEGGHIIIDISDDGRGLNVTRIREKILANGLASKTEIEGMGDQQIMQFIFRAGFSTAEKVTSVSGRGVGMDVVRTNIEKIGGTVELSSKLGKGSKFSIKIPLTLAIVSVLIVEAHGEKFAIPQINVNELISISPGSEFTIESINGALLVRLRKKLLPLISLGEVLELEKEPVDWTKKNTFVAVCNVGGADFGVIVDRVYDTEEIVVKPVAEILKSIPLYSGNTILGDGNVIMILDPNGLAKTIGNIEGDKQQPADATAQASKVAETSFLLVSTDQHAPKAIPLELVSRLEEIDVKHIEIADNIPVVQYRDELMTLVMLNKDLPMPDTGKIPVIVFNYDKRVIGVVVESVIDIVSAMLDIKLASKEKGCMGSMVINGKTTDIVDVTKLLSDIAGTVDLTGVNIQKAKECNLLFVEDSPFFRNLTVPFLSAVGYRVTVATNGAEALQIVTQDPTKFHVIVTDVEMPGMNGFEFAQACKEQLQSTTIPFIVYTSKVSENIRKKCQDGGIAECIMKTDRTGLLHAIAQCTQAKEREVA